MMPELLELKGIEKSYARGSRRLLVLTEVSLTVGVGETVAVIGSRYDGKTTLLKIAAGLERPDAGEVWFGGRELGALSRRGREEIWREEGAWVSREGGGLRYEMLDYVALLLRMGGRKNAEVEEVAMAALERVGVSAAARRRWEELSDWERVLVALARCVARRPRLVIVDDLLDGLGPSKT
jgi:predicted ABC-type transport system involved in lysophospholipase L1 biosynthesis ATPase subunit